MPVYSGLRNALSFVERLDNPGLLLDKWCPALGDRKDADNERYRKWLRDAQASVPAGYERAFARRTQALLGSGSCSGGLVVSAEARVQGRMIVGIGAASVWENNVALLRPWGVPYIPGSSLKGLAAATAHHDGEDARWRRGAVGRAGEPSGEWHRALFGDNDKAGSVTFHDAWWKPEGKKVPLELDTITVHHPDYYAGKRPPSDADSPNPVAFLSAHGTYLVILSGPAEDVEIAMQILKHGLHEHGIGAKTNAGYGRLSLDYLSPDERAERERQQARERSEELRRRVEDVKANNAADRVPELLGKADASDVQPLAQAIVDRLGKKWLRERRDKAWVVRLLEAAGVEL